jgi:hypothetical protein
MTPVKPPTVKRNINPVTQNIVGELSSKIRGLP